MKLSSIILVISTSLSLSGCSNPFQPEYGVEIHISGEVRYKTNKAPVPEASISLYRRGERYNILYGEERIYTEDLKRVSADTSGKYEIKYNIKDCKWGEVLLEASLASDSTGYYYSPRYLIVCTELHRTMNIYLSD